MEENSEISFNDTRIAQTKLAMLHNIDADLKVTNAFWILAAVQVILRQIFDGLFSNTFILNTATLHKYLAFV